MDRFLSRKSSRHEALRVHARAFVTLDQSPTGLVTLYADIGRDLSGSGSAADSLAAVARTAVARVPGAEWASITRGRSGAFSTVAATDSRAVTVDKIQYQLGTGPCVDAVLQDTVFRTDDLRGDPRWPDFAARAADHGVRAMLSFRLFLEDDVLIAGLNLYATRTAAFDDGSEVVGTLLATHGALAVTAAAARERADQLQRALASNRDIGVAIGVLMTLHKITRDQAFDLLRVASQTTNRKLVDVAAEVTDTGSIELPGRTGTGRRPASRPNDRPAPSRPAARRPRPGAPAPDPDR